MAETCDSVVSSAVTGAASSHGQSTLPESVAQGDEEAASGRPVEEDTKTVTTSETTENEQTKTQSNGDTVSLLGLADDDEVLAGTSEENRKRALWQFYSTGMLTHSHSDGEFPIYSQAIRFGGRVSINAVPSEQKVPQLPDKSDKCTPCYS
ncbi:hypothetical protein EAI_13302 [Harpegnathos saltator]|uniref:Uncharacterized protein n=1 Tax=Harpegnathos saltator TaxID=610380 RepID=E2C2M4_HARSA|nr:hypothetical protein EAI_13302 [Harpegnathos saltator]